MRIEIIEDLKGEVWIEDSGYEISNKGRIITKLGKLFKGSITKHGYVSAHVEFDDGFVARSAHRAVAHVFIPNPNNLPEVNHIDGIKLNNCVENLEWCTKKENQQHEVKVLQQRNGENNYNKKLSDKEVLEIYELCKNTDIKHKDIAKMYGVIPQEINLIIRGICWKHLKLEPLPKLTRGSRSRGKKIIWINKDKEYNSITACSNDLKNTYNLIITNYRIKEICKGMLEEWECQKFKYAI